MSVNKRQIKKNSKTAMHLLMLLDSSQYTPESFSFEGMEFVNWYQCGGMEPEWDYESAFYQLGIYIENHLAKWDFIETSNSECPVEFVCEFTPDLSTAKKVFNLAKQLIERGVA